MHEMMREHAYRLVVGRLPSPAQLLRELPDQRADIPAPSSTMPVDWVNMRVDDVDRSGLRAAVDRNGGEAQAAKCGQQRLVDAIPRWHQQRQRPVTEQLVDH